VSVRVYVEGGGDYKHNDTATTCRRGFQELFGKLGLPGRRLSVIACGSRLQTFNDFRKALRQQTGDFVILLVDSEGPVVAPGAWAHFHARDGWQRPAGTIQDQAHLMVQCMEAWFLADREALIEFYGQGFWRVHCRVSRTLSKYRSDPCLPFSNTHRNKPRKAPITRPDTDSPFWRLSIHKVWEMHRYMQAGCLTY
jgi:hypothetical protein